MGSVNTDLKAFFFARSIQHQCGNITRDPSLDLENAIRLEHNPLHVEHPHLGTSVERHGVRYFHLSHRMHSTARACIGHVSRMHFPYASFSSFAVLYYTYLLALLRGRLATISTSTSKPEICSWIAYISRPGNCCRRLIGPTIRVIRNHQQPSMLSRNGTGKVVTVVVSRDVSVTTTCMHYNSTLYPLGACRCH